MSAIKKFFKKKKQDIHFAKAGPGVRLSDASQPSERPQPRQESNAARCPPTESAQRAATAALARMEIQSRPKTASKPSSSMSAEVRHEMMAEKKAASEAARLAEIYGEKKERVLQASPLLKVENVLFTCELLDENNPVLGTYADIESKIHNFLVDSLEKEAVQAGALCIHTLEKSPDLRQVCLDTLVKLMDNLLESPDNPKFRRIRLKNKLIQQRIVAVVGAVQFLEGVGFKKKTIKTDGSGEEEEEEVMLVDEGVSLSAEHISECKEALLNAEPIRPELCRSTAVFHSAGMNPHTLSRVELPAEFYRISAEELKKEQELRQQAVEQMGMLRTKAMREREAQRELRRYRYCLVRVRFPDNHILQGVFFAHDKVYSLISWIHNCLALDFVPFKLTTPSGQKIEMDSENQESSLAEMSLAPASVLNFEFDAEVLRDVLSGLGGPSSPANVVYLKDELLKSVVTL